MLNIKNLISYAKKNYDLTKGEVEDLEYYLGNGDLDLNFEVKEIDTEEDILKQIVRNNIISEVTAILHEHLNISMKEIEDCLLEDIKDYKEIKVKLLDGIWMNEYILEYKVGNTKIYLEGKSKMREVRLIEVRKNLQYKKHFSLFERVLEEENGDILVRLGNLFIKLI